MVKFSDKYINSSNILKDAILGFEFEFYSKKAYYKLLEYLNRELGVETYGYRVYHSGGEVTENKFKIEPDLSLGEDGIELITGPMVYSNARIFLVKILKMLRTKDFSTDNKCSLHINISFDKSINKPLTNLNILKLILNIDEEQIYRYFPNRENNFYAKSIKRIIPFKSYDFTDQSINILQNSLELPDDKYFGVNFLNISDGRLEFRYIGDENYEEHQDEIFELMDYFIELTYNCIDSKLDENEIENLTDYLSSNINRFKKFNKLDNFIGDFPTINLEINRQNNLPILYAYYDKIYEQLYELITNIVNLSDCVINYDTDRTRLEVIGAEFKVIFDINKTDFIECSILNGTFINCNLVDCDVKGSSISNSYANGSDFVECKIEGSKIDEYSTITGCYIDNSHINCKMSGGVFRSGSLGDYAEIMGDVKIVSPTDNYFNPRGVSDEADSKKNGKYVINKNKKF